MIQSAAESRINPGWEFTTQTFLIIVFGFCLYHAAFWPAQMSPDSLDQWDQARTGVFANNHPAAISLLIAGLSSIWNSPAIVVLLQILTMAGAATAVLVELARLGVSKRVLIITAIFFAFYPVNGQMVTVIWKDILYSAELLFLMALILARLRGVESRRWFVSLALTLLALSLTRHNGLPTSMLFLVVFIVAGLNRGIRLRLAYFGGAGLLAAGLCMLVIFPRIGVAPLAPIYRTYLPLHLVGAFAKARVPLTGADRRLIRSFFPLNQLRRSYNCQSIVSLFWNPAFKGGVAVERLPEIIAMISRLALKHPGVVLDHQLCSTSMLWRVVPNPDEVIFTAPLEISQMVTSEKYGLKTTPLSTVLESWARSIATQFWSYLEILWRPALYLYLVIGTSILLAWRNRSSHWLILSLPVLANTLPLFVLISSPDFRYQYPVTVCALLLPVALLARPKLEKGRV